MAELVADQNAPRARIFAEVLREFEQGARQPGFDSQKAGGGHGFVGLPQTCCQHVHEVPVDVRVLLREFLKSQSADETQLALCDGEDRRRPVRQQYLRRPPTGRIPARPSRTSSVKLITAIFPQYSDSSDLLHEFCGGTNCGK